MDRHTAAPIVVVALLVGAVAWAKPKKEAAPKVPPSLHLRAIDLAHRLALVEVGGMAKAPPANYFTMTDDRQRHYIAQSCHCDPPLPSGARMCELEIPVGYERHPLTSLELHLRGLHGKVVAVAADEIRAAWAAAEQAHAPPTFAPGPTDGGAPPADLGGLDMTP